MEHKKLDNEVYVSIYEMLVFLRYFVYHLLETRRGKMMTNQHEILSFENIDIF